MTRTSKPSVGAKKPGASTAAAPPKKPAAAAPAKKGKTLDDAALDQVAGGDGRGRPRGPG